MQCPFCKAEMLSGTITGDGRSKVRFTETSNKIDRMDKLLGVGCLDAAYTLTQFSIAADYCPACKKMIFSTDIAR